MRAVALAGILALNVACAKRDGSLYHFQGDGRFIGASQNERWVPHTPNFVPKAQAPSADWHTALRRNAALLKRQKERPQQIISVAQRRAVNKALVGGLAALKASDFRFLRLKGDASTNVQFTGYYTPIIEARRQRTQRFKHALYAYPKDWKGKGPHLSRTQIDDEGLLANRELELAYTADPSDNFFMQVQGSGMVRYADNSLEMLAYAGKNGHAYVSVGRLLVERGVIDKRAISMNSIRHWCRSKAKACHALYNENPSYVFFRRGAKGPTGSGGEIVTGGLSVAVDPRVIPLGSILLGRVPMIDANDQVTHHQWRLLVAQDTGGAIKGSAHIDLYTGVGDAAEAKAQALHHYGQIWLILPATK